jgi:hypothetical protein
MTARPSAQLTSAQRTERDAEIYRMKHVEGQTFRQIQQHFQIPEKTAIRAEQRHRWKVEQLDLDINPLRVLQDILDVHWVAIAKLGEIEKTITPENTNGQIGVHNARVRAAQGLLEIMERTGLLPIHTGAWGLIRDVPDLVRAIAQVAENHGIPKAEIYEELRRVPGVTPALEAAGDLGPAQGQERGADSGT